MNAAFLHGIIYAVVTDLEIVSNAESLSSIITTYIVMPHLFQVSTGSKKMSSVAELTGAPMSSKISWHSSWSMIFEREVSENHLLPVEDSTLAIICHECKYVSPALILASRALSLVKIPFYPPESGLGSCSHLEFCQTPISALCTGRLQTSSSGPTRKLECHQCPSPRCLKSWS